MADLRVLSAVGAEQGDLRQAEKQVHPQRLHRGWCHPDRCRQPWWEAKANRHHETWITVAQPVTNNDLWLGYWHYRFYFYFIPSLTFLLPVQERFTSFSKAFKFLFPFNTGGVSQAVRLKKFTPVQQHSTTSQTRQHLLVRLVVLMNLTKRTKIKSEDISCILFILLLLYLIYSMVKIFPTLLLVPRSPLHHDCGLRCWWWGVLWGLQGPAGPNHLRPSWWIQAHRQAQDRPELREPEGEESSVVRYSTFTPA